VNLESALFRSIAQAIVPEVVQLSDVEWGSFRAIVHHAVSQRPRRMQRQLAIFLQALNVMALLRYGRTLPRLDVARRTHFLESVQDSRVQLMRRGFWGLRTLVFMGYYARPEATTAIGYRGNVRGWQARAPL